MKTHKITHRLLRLPQTRCRPGPFGVSFAFLIVLACTNVCRAAPGGGDKILVGETTLVAGGPVSTWARVNGEGKVIWVGATIPLSMVENQPPPGTGPAGAIAVLNYPPVVQQTTYFNHFELHSQAHGHPTNPGYETHDRYSEPHFDFHFYSIPVAQVLTIPLALPPLPDVPTDRLPAGYVQPEFSVPQMGRHCAPLSEFIAVGPLDVTTIVGFMPDASYMHFIEPMISRDFLLTRENFTLSVPMPLRLGRATSYPTECVVHYDKDADAYHIVFKGFEPID